MAKSKEIEEDIKVAITGRFFDEYVDVKSDLKDVGAEVFKEVEYARRRFVDCLLVGDEPDMSEVIKADYFNVRLLGEPEIPALLAETPLEDIPTSYSPTLDDLSKYVTSEPLVAGPITLPDDLRRVYSIIWDYNGRPSLKVPLATIASVEKKLGMQLPRELIAYIVASNPNLEAAFQSITKRFKRPDDWGLEALQDYVPDGFIQISNSGAALPDGRGNELGCEFQFLQGRDSPTVLLKTWDYDHEEDFEIDINLDFTVFEVNESRYDHSRCPAYGSYECMAWLEYGDPKILLATPLDSTADEEEDSEDDELPDPLHVPFAKMLETHEFIDVYDAFGKPSDYEYFYHLGKKAHLDLTGPGFAEFIPSIVQGSKRTKTKYDVYHKKFGAGNIQAEFGKNIVEVVFEDGSVRKMAREFLQSAP